MSAMIEYSHAFQPIIDTDDRKVVSYEVLLRGMNNEPPNFIIDQVADECFMDFDQASRERAIQLAASLGLDCGLNLNFTPGSISMGGGTYVQKTIDAAQAMGIEAHQLTLEITETEAIHAPNAFFDALKSVRQTGVTIAIDDFGSGHAGLNLLVDVYPDLIKIDKHLVRGIQNHGPRQSIVRAIMQVCLDLGIDVLAEGVETREEFDYCSKIGISLHQGFLFSRPGFRCFPDVPAEHLRAS